MLAGWESLDILTSCLSRCETCPPGPCGTHQTHHHQTHWICCSGHQEVPLSLVWKEKKRFLKSITTNSTPRLEPWVLFFEIKMTSGRKVTLAWLGPVYLEQRTNGPPECCWWLSQSCSRIPVGRPARSLRPNRAASLWWRTVKNPPLPCSVNTLHPVAFRREGGIWIRLRLSLWDAI